MEAFHRPLACHVTSKWTCPCVDGPRSIGRREMGRRVRLYREALADAVSSLQVEPAGSVA